MLAKFEQNNLYSRHQKRLREIEQKSARVELAKALSKGDAGSHL